MILTRAMGPGPRTIAQSSAFRQILLVAIAASTVLGCGPSAPSQASGGPVSSGVALASPDPSAVRWPGTTVLAVIALGAADAELAKAGADLQAAADKQDLAAMRGAADGLATLIDDLTPQIERLDAYAGTRRVGALYRASFAQIGAGAKQLRDAIKQGDSAGILAGVQQISRGVAEYAVIRREIGPLVEQALLQQRLLVK